MELTPKQQIRSIENTMKNNNNIGYINFVRRQISSIRSYSAIHLEYSDSLGEKFVVKAANNDIEITKKEVGTLEIRNYQKDKLHMISCYLPQSKSSSVKNKISGVEFLSFLDPGNKLSAATESIDCDNFRIPKITGKIQKFNPDLEQLAQGLDEFAKHFNDFFKDIEYEYNKNLEIPGFSEYLKVPAFSGHDNKKIQQNQLSLKRF